jgi:DNA-binding NarL/FixJ family response regulator
MIPVVVADDHLLFRAGLVALLSSRTDIRIVGEASDGQEAVALTRLHNPEVVVMDLRMPVLDGASASEIITTQGSPPNLLRSRVLILTTFDDDASVYGALRAGASGYLVKSAAPRLLVEAIHSVASGNGWIDPSIVSKVIAGFARFPRLPTSRVKVLESLTPREVEILKMVAHGMSNREIKESLILSDATVKTHVSHIIAKTGSRDRAHAVVLAYESGLVVPGDVG